MRALLVTIGSLGDLHPFIAVGRELRAKGVAVTLAVPADHVSKVEMAGLSAASVLPSFADTCARLDISEAEGVRRTLDEPYFVLDEILMPSLAGNVAALDVLARDADVVAGSVFAFGAGIVAEKHQLPLVDVVLQPMTMFSAWEPPQTPVFPLMLAHHQGWIGRRWNELAYRVMGITLRTRHGAAIDRVRRAQGMPPTRAALLVDGSPARVATICCYSPVLGGVLPDFPPNTHVVGFPYFDSETGMEETLVPELIAFLADGPPPIAFSLGSFAWAAAGDFYERAARTARAIGERAVLLTGQQTDFSPDASCFSIGYVPHSKLFPHCAAIVHHGGIGSVGQALRAGRPQLIVPFFGDQWDNAARIARLGVGLSLSSAQFTPERAASLLANLIENSRVCELADAIGRQVASEDGAAEAARKIIAAAQRRVSLSPASGDAGKI